MALIEFMTAGSYNFFYVLAIVTGAWVMMRIGRDRGWDRATWSCAVIAWVTGGVLGAVAPRFLLGDLVAARTCIGAVAGATIALIIAAKAMRIPVLQALDTTAIAVPLGGAVVRIGCFLAGCCQGTVTSLPIGVAEHAGELPRHPVQLYESAIELALAVVLTGRLRRDSRPGSALLLSIGSLATMRFILEFVRDSEKLGPLSLAQWVVAPAALICVALLIYLSRRPVSARKVTVHRMRSAPAVGITALALQLPAISTDSTFPRTYYSVGAAGVGGAYDHVYREINCNDEGGQDLPDDVYARHHSFSGGAVEVGARQQQSGTRGIGVRLGAFSMRHRAGTAVLRSGDPRPDPPYTRNNRGVSVIGDFDWKYLGLSVGATVGELYIRGAPQSAGYELGKQSVVPAFGLRLGPTSGGALEIRLAEQVPTRVPSPIASIAVASGDAKGNRLRLGVSEIGAFAGLNLMTPQGIEIIPYFAVGGDCNGCAMGQATQGSLMLRKWFRAARPPQAGK